MKLHSILNSYLGLVALALVLATNSSVSFGQTADSERISNLLAQAKSNATQADADAETLASFTRSKVSWVSHATQLEGIKGHINELGKLNKQLSDLRAEGSPWQQTAIDQVDVRLREMADLLTITINHLNDNPSKIHLQPYRDYAKANYELTSKLAKMISDFVDYDEAKSKAESLELKLELPGAESGT